MGVIVRQSALDCMVRGLRRVSREACRRLPVTADDAESALNSSAKLHLYFAARLARIRRAGSIEGRSQTPVGAG
jgi:hypothetical protein